MLMRRIQFGDLATITLGLILLVIVLGIAVVVKMSRGNTDQITTVSPTATPISATPVPQNGKPPVFYNETAENRLLDAIKSKQPLSHEDVVAKANILTILPAEKRSGILYKDSRVSIEYVNSADLFMVEILTPDIITAKAAANIWFRSHGISQKAICTMPVEFYLNYYVARQTSQPFTNFSPLGNGC